MTDQIQAIVSRGATLQTNLHDLLRDCAKIITQQAAEIALLDTMVNDHAITIRMLQASVDDLTSNLRDITVIGTISPI